MKEILKERFNGIFEEELLLEISNNAQLLQAKEGEELLQIGQKVVNIPLVLNGVLKVFRVDETGRELLLYYVNPNQSCAMTFTCCMQQYPSEISAVVEEDADVLLVPIRFMDQWLVKFPSWKSFVMKSIRMRFHELLVSIDQLAFLNLEERLTLYLKEKVKNSGSTIVNLSHEQIANELATSRVVISRLLRKLEEEKKVILYRNQIKVMREL